ncbi:NAD-dependent epimerase/dehydratase family protein [Aquirufa sp. OSTEICH-129V]|uniref:NAD-dependent epimerase/dehydratase family protein n=1 Tax=Aquirufa avitistagni TaxID=3104728 RepID=A0ABW6DC32_9BACT
MNKLLVIGAGGQLGTELTQSLANTYGSEAVIATDFQESARSKFNYCRFKTLNVLDKEAVGKLLQKDQITQVYHLAAILSATGEKDPMQAWDMNMRGLLHVLELARENKLEKIFWPSSIAVFGPNTPKQKTPQDALKNPTTVYGISKLAGEHWCEYYFNTYGVDVRSLRFPGLIGYKSLAGGGTTDYAVDIYHQAIREQSFTCFLQEDTYLPMMYMDDAVQATMQLMAAPASSIRVRTSYNVSGMSFSPREIAESIQSHHPNFQVQYAPDFRQQIADSWPSSINDDCARNDWGWKAEFDLPKMTTEILTKLPSYIHNL